MMNINYLITGATRSGYLEVHGKGTLDQSSGEYKMDLDVRNVSHGWDPVFIPTMCCDNLSYFAAKISSARPQLSSARSSLSQIANSGMFSCNERGSLVADKNGKGIVVIRAKGYLTIDYRSNTLTSRTVVLDGFSDMDQFGGAKRVSDYNETIRSTVPLHASGISVFKIECNNGETLFGTRWFPYAFDIEQELSPPLELDVSIDIAQFASFHTGGRQVSFKSKIVERP